MECEQKTVQRSVLNYKPLLVSPVHQYPWIIVLHCFPIRIVQIEALVSNQSALHGTEGTAIVAQLKLVLG